MIVETCLRCNIGKVDYLSELHLIPNTHPQEAGIEGICDNCMTYYYHKFRLYQYEITVFDEHMNEKDKQIVKIE